jgi:hypothetical protein
MKHSTIISRGLIAHTGVYLVIIGMLAGINMLSSPYEAWFLFPALAWGALLGIHILWKLPLAKLKPRWRRFLRHLGVYTIVISMLAGINFLTLPYEAWFLYPGLVWGAVLTLHFLFGIVLRKPDDRTRSDHYRVVDRRPSSAERKQQSPRTAKLTNRRIQAHLDKALGYKAQIDAIVAEAGQRRNNERLQQLVAQVDDWIEDIKDLAARIDYFEQNALIRRDLESVPKNIQSLKARLARETNPANRDVLERTLKNHQKQLAALKQLGDIMQRAEIQIESTLSALGAIYFQVLAGQSASHVADYSHLSAEVDEEVQLLQDHLEALNEVKFGRAG